MRLTPQIESLIRVAARLGSLRSRFVFVGGSIVDLLLTDPQAPFARPTDDIDLIVELATIADYYELAEQLRSVGFKEDVGSQVICRWLANDLVVDVMPSREDILGFSNRWYVSTIQHSAQMALPDGVEIATADGPHFIATKLEAFASRGKSDMFGSHDFEDIVAIFNGRAEVGREIQLAPVEVRAFIAETMGVLVNRIGIREAIEGHLASMTDSMHRSNMVLDRLQTVTQLNPDN